MSLEDSVRWSEHFRDSRVWNVAYQTPARADEPNRRWVQLWEADNPRPSSGTADWDPWYAEYGKMCDRVWVAWCLPQFRVWDWNDEDVALARGLVRGHVCGVCGGVDDPGCAIGC